MRMTEALVNGWVSKELLSRRSRSAPSAKQGLSLAPNGVGRLLPTELPRRTLRQAATIVAVPWLYVEAI